MPRPQFFLRTAWLAISTSCLAFALAGVAPATPSNAAPGSSFLQAKADTVPQLIRQVQTNRVVRLRFSRCFHLREDQVVAFLRDGLVPSVLPRGGVFTVSYIGPHGIYPAQQALPEGTRVFARRGGRPVLLCSSGNPLVPFQTVVHQVYVHDNALVLVSPSREILEMTTPDPQIVPVGTAPVYHMTSAPVAPKPGAPAVAVASGPAAPK